MSHAGSPRALGPKGTNRGPMLGGSLARQCRKSMSSAWQAAPWADEKRGVWGVASGRSRGLDQGVGGFHKVLIKRLKLPVADFRTQPFPFSPAAMGCGEQHLGTEAGADSPAMSPWGVAGQGVARRSGGPRLRGSGLECRAQSSGTRVRGTRRKEQGEADINYAPAVCNVGLSVGSLT